MGMIIGWSMLTSWIAFTYEDDCGNTLPKSVNVTGRAPYKPDPMKAGGLYDPCRLCWGKSALRI